MDFTVVRDVSSSAASNPIPLRVQGHCPTTLADLLSIRTQTSSCYPLHRNRATLFENPPLCFPMTRQRNCLSPNPVSLCNPTEKGTYLKVILFLTPERPPFVMQALKIPPPRPP